MNWPMGGELSEALVLYNRVIYRFGEASEPALREQVARALVNKGIVLGQRGDSEQAISVYDDVVARFGEASFILKCVNTKLKTLAHPEFGKHNQNWLYIYDNLPLPNVVWQSTFDVIFIEHRARLTQEDYDVVVCAKEPCNMGNL